MERLKWGKKIMEEIAMLNEFLPTQSKVWGEKMWFASAALCSMENEVD